MEAVAGVGSILSIVLGVVSLVCWIMVLIPIFKDNVGLGILGIICGLFAFIYGWIKVKEYNIQKVMLVWTIVFVLTILLQVIFGVSVMGMAAQESGAL
jgi:hypothetical protein